VYKIHICVCFNGSSVRIQCFDLVFFVKKVKTFTERDPHIRFPDLFYPSFGLNKVLNLNSKIFLSMSLVLPTSEQIHA
jgi:hypothetical protein